MTHRRILLIGITALLLASFPFSLAGEKIQSQPPPGSATAPPGDHTSTFEDKNQGSLDTPVLHQRYPRYQLCKSDTIELNFTFAPAFNQTVTVQPDGYITLRPLGDIRAEGKTMPELTQMLQAGYAKILRDPVFTVELKDFEKPHFIAGGEVERPGKYELRGDTTVAEAVAVAGGFKEEAKHSQVLLFRRVSNDWVEVKQLNLKKMFQQKDLREDLYLQPGDMLYVPKSFISKIERFLPTPRLGMLLSFKSKPF
ncbi:MAG: hypothetical protein DMG06_28395 [Acidobacteria bacterium]|nr:MAG: hypothetical protein DMG06_28395 [Acidobacteriota bacterium]